MTETQLEIPIQLLTTEEAARRLAVSIHWLKASRYRPELDGRTPEDWVSALDVYEPLASLIDGFCCQKVAA